MLNFKYWKTNNMTRQREFDIGELPIFKEFWDKVLFYKDNLDEFNKDIINTEKASESKSNDAFNELQISDSKDNNTPTKKNVKSKLLKKIY